MWLLNALVLMSPLNPNKYDNFHIHMDYLILYGFTGRKINDMIWYDMIWYDDMIYSMIWYDIWYDTILYDMIYDMIRYDKMRYDIWYMIWYVYDILYVMIWYIILFSCIPLELPINLTTHPSYPFSLCPSVTGIHRTVPKWFCHFAISRNSAAATGDFSALNWTPVCTP